MSEEKQDNKSEHKTEEPATTVIVETSTKSHQTPLNERDILIMEYKFKGLTYKKIVEKLKEHNMEIGEDSIKYLFGQNGRLKIAYESWREGRIEQIEKFGLDKAIANIDKMIDVLIEVADKGGKGDAPRVAAANSIIDRVLGRAINRNVNVNVGKKTKADEVADAFRAGRLKR